MNKLIKYFGLCLVVCLEIIHVSCGSSDKDRTNEKNNGHDKSTQFIDGMNLQNDSLTLKNIKAFEQRAIQKLEDLKDYFEILSDSTIDLEFRDQAMSMAEDLFATKNNTITLKMDEKQECEAQKLESFFTFLKKNEYGLLSFEIHDISVIKNIKHLNVSEYMGAIKFNLFISTKQRNVKKLLAKSDMQCDIIAKKIQKKFGNETKLVWEVFLGDIFQIQQ